MSFEHSSRKPTKAEQAKQAREQATHGDFFFAKWATSDGYVRESPCFVLSPDQTDPHNELIILKCTSQPKRTAYDVPISCLRKASVIRTNKIYTIQRTQLLFPLAASLSNTEYAAVIEKVKEAQGLRTPLE